MVQIALATSDERGKKLLYQCPHWQNNLVLLCNLPDDFEIFEVICCFAARLERMAYHGRTSQVHEAVLSKAATEYLQNDVG